MRNLRSLIGIFISIGLLVALAVSPAFAQPRFDPPGLERAIEAQEQHTDALLANPRVVGTAVGVGAKGGAVVKIYTEKEGVAGLPRSLDGVPVVVKVTGKIQALHHRPGHGGGPSGGGEVLDPTSRFDRPVPIGVSSGSKRLIKVNNQYFCTTGTLGARVSGNNSVYAQSNAHVYAQAGSTTVDEFGLDEPAAVFDAISQPGRADVGCDLRIGDQIGTLHNWEPILFDGSPNTIDAAIALTNTTNVGTATPSDGYGTPSSMTISAFVGQAVQKYGRTTSLTLGTVDSINATVDVEYDNGIARFVDQIIINGSAGAFSGSGDSGSLIVTQVGNNPVALLFAGNSIITVGNPIDEVLARLAVTIDGEAEINSPPTAFTLSADGFKVKGLQKVNLTWSGATTPNVDIYRDGAWIVTTGNAGDYRDNIDERGGGTYSYQACESGTLPPICSTTETVIF
jgi:hypothetical protein